MCVRGEQAPKQDDVGSKRISVRAVLISELLYGSLNRSVR
ncbi:hypothetical protein BH23CHL2_BH23CHL2_04490 [soil metagenome]